MDVTTWTDFARSRTDVAAFAADPSRAALVPELTGQDGGAGVALTQTWKLPVP